MVAETPNYPRHKDLDPKASRYVNVDELEWEPTGFDGVDWKILFRDQERGLLTALVRWQPQSTLDLHEHVDIEQSYMLEGSLEDDEGVCTAGNYVWRPIGNRHRAWSTNGALILATFQEPNVFLEGRFAGKKLE
ncbi:MAG: cupin domain-containing protein [Gammaproteobacteria bacterium]|nr:cupin domain-containing protein [Gammaproteobacteria bacterium]MDE0413578.1 cupin domain-containing protein [Gammaproteobacteria bacterium]